MPTLEDNLNKFENRSAKGPGGTLDSWNLITVSADASSKSALNLQLSINLPENRSLVIDRCFGAASGLAMTELSRGQDFSRSVVSPLTLEKFSLERASLLRDAKLGMTQHTAALKNSLAPEDLYLHRMPMREWSTERLTIQQKALHAEWSKLDRLVGELEKDTAQIKGGALFKSADYAPLYQTNHAVGFKTTLERYSEARIGYGSELARNREALRTLQSRHYFGNGTALVVGEVGKHVFDSHYDSDAPASLRTAFFDIASPTVLLSKAMPWYLKAAVITGVHVLNRYEDDRQSRR
jgi:hypothetical protein